MERNELINISRQLIASDKTDEALKVLLNFVRNNNLSDKYFDELVLLSSKYNSIKKKSEIGIVGNSEFNLETNRIRYVLLELIKNISVDTSKNIRQVEILGNNNIVIQGIKGSNINISGNFQISDEIKKDEKLIEKLLEIQSKVKILFLASNPLDTDPLRLDKEIRNIETELIRSKNRDQFELIKLSAVRVKDLQDALLYHSPNFIHFSGHGNGDGIALLDNITDKTQLVQSEPLANLFKLFSNDLACVFLNSCYSIKQAKLIRKYIPNVIGMNTAVADNTAIEFATVFYKGIGAGKEIGFSYEFALNSLDLNNILGSDIPVYL